MHLLKYVSMLMYVATSKLEIDMDIYSHPPTHTYTHAHAHAHCDDDHFHSLADTAHASAMISGDTSVRSGDDLVLTCTGTGYPQVSVNFEYGTILSNVTVSEEVVLSTATPDTPFTVARNITVRSVTVRECMERITCVANATDVTASAYREIEVAGELNEHYYLIP